jgi:hypothetical protein
MSLVLARSNGEEADSANNRGVTELRVSRDDGVGDVVVDALSQYQQTNIFLILCLQFIRFILGGRKVGRTEYSSCFTSKTVPSLKVHLTISVSGSTPLLTASLFDKADQKWLKFWSLIRCQTWLNLASMTADSVTEVEVGIREVILRYRES